MQRMMIAVTVAVVAIATVITDIDTDHKTDDKTYNNATSDDYFSGLNYLDDELFNKSFCATTAAVY